MSLLGKQVTSNNPPCGISAEFSCLWKLNYLLDAKIPEMLVQEGIVDLQRVLYQYCRVLLCTCVCRLWPAFHDTDILARMSVSVTASWNVGLYRQKATSVIF